LKIRIESSIPIAAGMGSSAATSIAIIRGLSAHFNQSLSPEAQSDIAYEVEKIHHGTPSGVDNTVVAYGKPVIFSRNKGLQSLEVGADILLVVGDTGIQSETAHAVAQVRKRWQAETARFDSMFDQISAISEKAAEAIQSGQIAELGSLMNQNQTLLTEIGVSSAPLQTLIQAALDAGASGAKLSGAGQGGNMIALIQPDTSREVTYALRQAGAARIIETVIAK
jgi:mevalonate kinase